MTKLAPKYIAFLVSCFLEQWHILLIYLIIGTTQIRLPLILARHMCGIISAVTAITKTILKYEQLGKKVICIGLNEESKLMVEQVR